MTKNGGNPGRYPLSGVDCRSAGATVIAAASQLIYCCAPPSAPKDCMSRPPATPDPRPADAAAADPDGRRTQRSRMGQTWLGGYFAPEVTFAIKTLALRQGTTVQALIGRALNDLLEKHGFGRPASEQALPRGAAARRRPHSDD